MVYVYIFSLLSYSFHICTDTDYPSSKARPLLTNSVPFQPTVSLSSTSGDLSKLSHDHQSTPNPMTPKPKLEEDKLSESRSESGSLESETVLALIVSEGKPCHEEERSECESKSDNSCPKLPNSIDETVSQVLPSECVTVPPLSPSPGNQTPDSQSDRLVTPDKLAHQKCEESHESLHVHGIHPEIAKVNPKEDAAIGNGHILCNGEATKLNSAVKLHKPSSIKLQNGHTLQSNGGLLQEAMDDISPHVNRIQPHPIKSAVGAQLGLDGMPLLAGEVQHRIRDLVMEPRREMDKMRAQLREIQLLIQKQGVGRLSSVEGVCNGGVSIEDQIASALEDQVCTIQC